MQFSIIFAAAIYLGSYLPLSLILLAQDIDPNVFKHDICTISAAITLHCENPLRNPEWSLSAVAICVVGLASTSIAFRELRSTRPVSIVESKHVPADFINYVIPYIVSFMSLDYDQWPKLVGFGIFLVWMFWITYMSGQIALNPMLAVLGWKLYEIKYTFSAGSKTHVGRMLSKYPVSPGQSYRQNELQDVMVAIGADEGREW